MGSLPPFGSFDWPASSSGQIETPSRYSWSDLNGIDMRSPSFKSWFSFSKNDREEIWRNEIYPKPALEHELKPLLEPTAEPALQKLALELPFSVPPSSLFVPCSKRSFAPFAMAEHPILHAQIPCLHKIYQTSDNLIDDPFDSRLLVKFQLSSSTPCHYVHISITIPVYQCRALRRPRWSSRHAKTKTSGATCSLTCTFWCSGKHVSTGSQEGFPKSIRRGIILLVPRMWFLLSTDQCWLCDFFKTWDKDVQSFQEQNTAKLWCW